MRHSALQQKQYTRTHPCETAKPFRWGPRAEPPKLRGSIRGHAPYFIPVSATCARPAKPEPFGPRPAALRAKTDENRRFSFLSRFAARKCAAFQANRENPPQRPSRKWRSHFCDREAASAAIHLRLHHPDVREVAVIVLAVEAVAYDKLVGDHEAHVVGPDIALAALGLIEEARDL